MYTCGLCCLLLGVLISVYTAGPISARAAFAESQGNTDTDLVKVVELQRSHHDLQHSSRALRKRAGRLAQVEDNVNVTSRLRTGYSILRSTGASFLAPLSIGAQSFMHVLDTGSADTWVVSSSFTCLDMVSRKSIPQQKCYFGPTYTTDSTFQQIQNQNFNITYGDGEFLTGILGNTDVTLADITVAQQEISLATQAAWQGDGITSGIIGLAYPALTAAYPGTDPHLDVYCSPGGRNPGCNQVPYSSLTDNMFFKQQLSKPVFALALSRDESDRGSGGYLTIGGIPSPDVVGVKNIPFATTSIQILPGDDKYRYYLMNIDGLIMLPPGSQTAKQKRSTRSRSNKRNETHAKPGTTSNAPPPNMPGTIVSGSANEDYILDSGTTLSFIPHNLAQRYNSMFDPPAAIDSYSGFYVIPCDAAVPSLGVRIGGTTFWHNPKDLVKQFDSSGQYCVSGIQSANTLGGPNILGDVFLNNVLAVFDLGAKQLSFAARTDYDS